ncbi:hypothetical protein SLS55_009398 [Diplodia seriata]|uniref:Uncharacterized protein n=1 Tax=Diplodia seriata TaxID=420778 RepID=A0ABR3C5T1_9PEZI
MAEANFRARKRQKVYRKRLDEDDDTSFNHVQGPNVSATVADTQANNGESGQPSVAEILRRARKQKARGVGVEFSSSGGSKQNGSSEIPTTTTAVVPPASGGAPEQQQVEVVAAKEFAPQTGMVVDTLDKHM